MQNQPMLPLMDINSQSSDKEMLSNLDSSSVSNLSGFGKRNFSHLIESNMLNGNIKNEVQNEDSDSNTLTAIKKFKLETDYQNENGENFESNNNSTTKINSSKKPSDIDMAYNIFVRRVVDDTLDRTVTFCEQPKDIISNLEDVCSTAFSSFDKSRHRIKIRGYLKACRRNSKKHNGKVSMKDTPSHMCSEKAFLMANEALVKVNKELQILKLAKLGRSENPDSISQGNSSDDGRVEIDNKSLDHDSSPCNSDFNYLKHSISLSENDPFSAVFPGIMPPLYGILPPPPLLPSSIPGLPGRGCTPPPAHCNYFNMGVFSLLGSNTQQPGTTMILDKVLQCTSIDPDFGVDLVRNKLSAQEAINCMRVMARFLLNRSLMVESYLIREMSRSSYFYPSDDI